MMCRIAIVVSVCFISTIVLTDGPFPVEFQAPLKSGLALCPSPLWMRSNRVIISAMPRPEIVSRKKAITALIQFILHDERTLQFRLALDGFGSCICFDFDCLQQAEWLYGASPARAIEGGGRNFSSDCASAVFSCCYALAFGGCGAPRHVW